MLSYLFPLVLLCQNVLGGDYSNLPNVVYLTAENFTEYTSKDRWLTVFYLHSCGGCTKYQPFFSNFSSYLKEWKPLLKVAAVDCEISDNTALCSTLKVGGVPNLRYFSEHRQLNVTGFIIEDKYSFIDLRNQLLNLLRGEIPLDGSSAESVQLSSIVSAITASDAVSRIPESPITTPKPVVTNATETVPAVLDPVYSDDIFRSLTTLLYTDITLIDDIHQDELSALREFLLILNKLLPASPTYKTKLSEIYQWVNSIYEDPTQAASFTGATWHNKLKELDFPQFNGEFVACKGSKPSYRGYTCGLWILFHVLTVEHYKLAEKYPDLEGDAVAHAMNRFIPRYFSCSVCAFHFAANSANIARSGESRFPEHRQKPNPSEFTWNESILDQLPPRPVTAQEEVLWLNTIHNRVNRRLAGDATEDPKAKKIQYPARKFCPACWSQEPNGDGIFVLGKTEEARTALLNFLVNHYKPQSWVTEKLNSTFFEASNLHTPFKRKHFNWEDNTSRDLLTIVIITVLLTLVALVTLILLSRFLWGYRKQRKGGYKAPV